LIGKKIEEKRLNLAILALERGWREKSCLRERNKVCNKIT
jgi:hypothetical protein